MMISSPKGNAPVVRATKALSESISNGIRKDS